MTALEKAARAIAAADAKNGATGDALYANNPALYQRLARAVLMAVREPDEAVADAGEMEHERQGWNDGTRAGQVFTAMIDAILNEGPK